MTRHTCTPTVALLLLALAVPALGQNYFLYTPQPVSAEEKSSVKEGVLVREITVQKGDTLSALSRKFSGRASYYPQILLFNDIRNPHLIHIGDNLKVPVTKGELAPPTASAATRQTTAVTTPPAPTVPKQTTTAQPDSISELSPGDLKPAAGATSGKQTKREQNQARKTKQKRKPKNEGATPAALASNKPTSGKKLYEKALAAYRQGNCKTALELFDRFLADYPAATQAPDASLYKADCYLKLSGQ